MIKFVSFFGERSALFEQLNERAVQYAADKGIEFVWVPQKPYDRADVIARLNDADAGMIDVEPYDEEVFGRLNERCRLLVRFGVGFDKVDLDAATKHGLCIARTAGSNKTGVAEMALLMILASRRALRIHRRTMESGVWNKCVGHELAGKKVGILGFGSIGAELARLLRGFDCEMVAYDARRNPAAAEAYGVKFADLDEIFTTCDAISVHLPYTPQTHGLIGRELLGKMKSDAVIVCTARGKIIDEAALYDALAQRRIGGAGLDVFETEPLPAESPLLTLDNLIVTPHASGQTVESLWNTYKKGIDIVSDFFAGRQLDKGDLLNPDYTTHARA